MLPLLSKEGRAELRSLARGKALYAFDFDGTLAPIVADPAAARAPERVTRPLAQLARQVPVAVISGRARRDLVARLPAEIRYLIGNHGNEGVPEGPVVGDFLAICQRWIVQLEAPLAGADAEGVRLEDKGQSLSLHYRAAPDPEAARKRLQQLVQALEPRPKVIDGRMVLNLLPPSALTKFEALQALVAREGADKVLFVGDDDTDEIVFARAPQDWTTVRIDPVADSRARFFLDEQAAIEVLLAHLLAEHADETEGR